MPVFQITGPYIAAFKLLTVGTREYLKEVSRFSPSQHPIQLKQESLSKFPTGGSSLGGNLVGFDPSDPAPTRSFAGRGKGVAGTSPVVATARWHTTPQGPLPTGVN